ncbi:MAG: type II toxin-antitoxin system prevent-host-death family antitoxin [Acidobacteriota bacterium]
MGKSYSLYEAKAKFSEVMRKVREGKRVVISYRGEDVAEIRPIERSAARLSESLPQLEADGILGAPATREGDLNPLVSIPGALKRFLESRE